MTEYEIPVNRGKMGQEYPRVPSLFSIIRSKKFLVIISTLLILLFFFVPVLKLIYLSFSSEAGLSLQNYSEILRDPITWKTIGNTLYIVLGAVFLSVVLGVCMAWLVAYSDVRGKKAFEMLIMLTFVIPSYVVTLSWTQLMSPNGLLANGLQLIHENLKPWNLYSYGGMIFVMGLHHFPLVYLFTVSVLKRIPRDLEWASRVSGGGRYRTFMKVTLPLALPGIVGGGLLSFLAGLDNFGIPAFLGIPADIRVLSTFIYEQVIGFGPSAFAKAAVLSVILGILAILGTVVQWVLLRKAKHLETTVEDHKPRFSLGKIRVVIEILLWIFLVFICFVPLISMGVSSLIRAYGLPPTLSNLTLDHYHYLLFESSKVQNAIWNSLLLAFVTVILCLLAGTAFAYYRTRKSTTLSRGLEIVIGLPYALPGVVLALAMIFTWMEPIPGWNPGIYGSIAILFIAYITRFLILQVRGGITALLQVDLSMEEAAQICGANGRIKWVKILFPLLLPGILSGALLVFLNALTELTVSSLLWSSGSETIGVIIFGMQQEGSLTNSTALSSLIVLSILLGFVLYYVLQKVWNRKVVR